MHRLRARAEVRDDQATFTAGPPLRAATTKEKYLMLASLGKRRPTLATTPTVSPNPEQNGGESDAEKDSDDDRSPTRGRTLELLEVARIVNI